VFGLLRRPAKHIEMVSNRLTTKTKRPRKTNTCKHRPQIAKDAEETAFAAAVRPADERVHAPLYFQRQILFFFLSFFILLDSQMSTNTFIPGFAWRDRAREGGRGREREKEREKERDIYIYIYIYIYIHTHTHTHTYIRINEREREKLGERVREGERDVCVCLCVCAYVYIYVYI
jgi:hypothetical protein